MSERVRDDAYGHLIYDYHRGAKPREIVEREDGLIGFSTGPATYFETSDVWPDAERQAVAHAHGRVLDIGCGAGRHSLFLQEQGLDVVGIDTSPLAIRVCKERGLRDARVLSITQVNSKLGQFGSILMMGHNFGLFGSEKRARWLLRRFRSLTTDDALVITQSFDPYDTDNPHHKTYHEFNRRRGRLGGQLRIRVRYQTYVGEWFDYLKVSRQEMKAIVHGTGWSIVKCLPDQGPLYTAILAKPGRS